MRVSPLKRRQGPRYCVWELTLACNASCLHCGSNAGRPRSRELDTSEALGVCEALARIGTYSVTFSGGEPLLRDDWSTLALRLISLGVRVDLISNGLCITPTVARRIADSGIHGVTLSIDGTQSTHDRLRGTPQAYERTLAALRALGEAGLPVGVSTQVNRWNLGELAEIERVIAQAGVRAWQLQLTMQVGRSVNTPDLVLAPEQVPQVVEFVASDNHAITVFAADNIGWMPSCEPALRRFYEPHRRFFSGCHAGITVLGVTSDGTVRGCLSMPPCFDEGSVRVRSLEEIWADESLFRYNRAFSDKDLTGPCAKCAFGRVCRGGCKTLAHAATGRVSENPFCVRTVQARACPS